MTTSTPGLFIPEPGETLSDRFVIEEVVVRPEPFGFTLAEGSFVFRAFDTKLEKEAGIKTYIDNCGDVSAEHVERERVVHDMLLRHHSSVLPLYELDDVVDTEGHHLPVLVTEWAPHGSLHNKFVETKDDLRTLIGAASQVADALKTMHDEGVVHADVKPSNTFLGAEGQVWLGDFGSVRPMGELALHSRHIDKPLVDDDITHPSYGTAGYVPIESLEGAPLTDKRDTFALGVFLHGAITRILPWYPDERSRYFKNTLELSPRPLRHDTLELPKALRSLVFSDIHPDQDIRYDAEKNAHILRSIQI